MQWLWTIAAYVNVWRRASECERQRSLQEIQLADFRAQLEQAADEITLLRQLLRVSTISVDLSGTIIKVSEEFSDLVGYKPGELMGSRLDLLIPNERRLAYREVAKSAKENRLEIPAHPQTYELRGKDGGPVPIVFTVSQRQNGSGPKFEFDVRSRETHC
jgi:PAS domain S-box-containing protein